MNNIILMTDSYKVSHWKQYPVGTQFVYSYFESRGGMYDNVLFFGLQYYLKRYLLDTIIDDYQIIEAESFFADHFGNKDIFNRKGWMHIASKHKGKLPIEIKAVEEGTLVPIKNVLFTVENTCPECFWLTSYLETLIEKVWYPCTVATKSFYLKRVIKKYLDKTGDDVPDFKLHDFGYRGSTSEESAGIGDAAHLVNFKGTDTLAGIRLVQDYYNEKKNMPAFSIPAAEHSTITSWGKEHEVDAYRNMLDKFPKGLVAVVSDSYDIYNAVSNLWGKELRDKILLRDGTLVIRPDSGDPIEVLKEVLAILGDTFGYGTNEKGYKVLPRQIRVIQGDGIDEKTLPLILEGVTLEGWSVDNIAFGSGGGLIQNVTRDTLQFAYKCSNITINGEDRDVYKDPITDSGKASKKGKLRLVKVADTIITIPARHFVGGTEHHYPARLDWLQTVYKDGELLIDQNLGDIRKKVEEAL